MFKAAAIIVAAGSSRRMGGLDKIFIDLGGRPVIAWSVEACQNSPLVDQIVLVMQKKHLQHGHDLVAERRWHKVKTICAGGERRQDSVNLGLKALDPCQWVIVHDGARPFLTPELLAYGLQAAEETGAAVAAVPVTDTIKEAGANRKVIRTLERSHLWQAQTPQIFRQDILISAQSLITDEVTDDAALVESLGYRIKLFDGDYRNIKITTPADLALARAIVESRV